MLGGVMKLTWHLLFVVLQLFGTPSFSVEFDPAKQDQVEKKLNAIKDQFTESCFANKNDVTPCNQFTGVALAQIYGISDFRRPEGGYLPTAEIAVKVLTHPSWLLLGTADDPTVLQKAGNEANLGRVVISVGEGHVALIIPGPLRATSWGQAVPNSASLSHHQPEKAYVGQPLSQAWKKETASKVRIYERGP